MSVVGTSPIIDTRDGLKAYILRNLGHPVIDVEVDDSQLEDAINESVAEFIPYSDDGIESRWGIMDLTCGVHEYQLPYEVFSVVGLHPPNYLDYSPAPSDLFSINQYIANDMVTGGMGRIDLVTLELVQQQIQTLEVVYGKRLDFNYNAITKVLYLPTDPTRDGTYYPWTGSGDGLQKIFIEFYQTLKYDPNPDVQQNIYDVKWVQQYAVALARRQWGINLMKYDGTVLPNGMTINSASMIDMAEVSKTHLMEQLREEWQEPVDFFIA